MWPYNIIGTKAFSDSATEKRTRNHGRLPESTRYCKTGATGTPVSSSVAWTAASQARAQRNAELRAAGSEFYVVRPQGANDWMLFETDDKEKITPGELRHAKTYKTMARNQALDIQHFRRFYVSPRSRAGRNLVTLSDHAVTNIEVFTDLLADVAGI